MRIDTSQTPAPLKLFVERTDGNLKEQLEAHACGTCKIVHPSHQAAWECHGLRRCDCGEPIEQTYFTACATCRAKHDAEREAAEVAAMNLVPESEASMLYCRCCEKFFDSSAELLEDHEDNGYAKPDFAEACSPRYLTFDAEDVLDTAIARAEFDPETCMFGAAEVLELDLLLKDWSVRHPMVAHFSTGEKVDLRGIDTRPTCDCGDRIEAGLPADPNCPVSEIEIKK